MKQLSTAFDDTQTAQLAGDVYGDSLSRQDDLSRLHLGHNPLHRLGQCFRHSFARLSGAGVRDPENVANKLLQEEYERFDDLLLLTVEERESLWVAIGLRHHSRTRAERYCAGFEEIMENEHIVATVEAGGGSSGDSGGGRMVAVRALVHRALSSCRELLALPPPSPFDAHTGSHCLAMSENLDQNSHKMSASADLDLLDPPSLAHSLTAAARARQQPHAGSPSSYADAADADAATRTALEAAEKAVALLRAQLTTTTTMFRAGDNESSRAADAAPLPPAELADTAAARPRGAPSRQLHCRIQGRVVRHSAEGGEENPSARSGSGI